MQQLNRTNQPNTKLRPLKVIQFGGGNFLRAFCDNFIQIANNELNFNGNIAIIQYISATLGEQIRKQDGLYHLVLQGMKDGKPFREIQLIDSVTTVVNPHDDYDQFMALAHCEDVRYIISNTTEAGIVFAATDDSINKPAVSFPAKLTQLIFARYQAVQGDMSKGYIILPCELIEDNGKVLQEICLRYANLWQLPYEFIVWMVTANHFTSTLVDRIVSGYPKDDSELLAQIPYHDELVVVGETFASWIIAGADKVADELVFNNPRFNVKLVNSLDAYRQLKVRLLNAVHTALVPVAYLYGIDDVRTATENPLIARFLTQLINAEIIPTLSVSKDEAEGFAREVMARFANPYVKHMLMSIALNSTSKYVTRDLPIVNDYQAIFASAPKCLSLALAALIVFYRGKRGNQEIALNDTPQALELFANNWSANSHDFTALVHNILSATTVWGCNLAENKSLVTQVTEFVANIMKDGVEATLKGVLA